MNNIHGSTLTFPIQVDARGTLKTVSDPVNMAEQFLLDLIETRVMEHVMVPGYGIQDSLFAVMGAGFTVQLAADLEEKARDYLPILDSISVTPGELSDGAFMAGFTLDQQRAAIEVGFRVRGSNTPGNLVFPMWQLLSLA